MDGTPADRNRRHRAGAVLRRLALLGVLLLALTAVLVAGFAVVYPRLAAPPAAGPVIIVLGGGVEPDGTLDRQSLGRLETGVALYRSGLAPGLHLTGGVIDDSPPVAETMRRIALERGVPESAISVETHSKSTLQNALFSGEVLGGLPTRAILVTSAYHLPRAWASFRWAGAEAPVLVAARVGDPQLPSERAAVLGRETLAWWFNLGRVAAWHAAAVVGVPEASRAEFLR